MIAVFFSLVGFFLLLGILCARSGLYGPDDDCPPPPPPHYEPWDRTPPRHFGSRRWEKNHFINMQRHRNDEKEARNRRNQTPWW